MASFSQDEGILVREWGKLSDRTIAEMCAVSHPFVLTLRRQLSPAGGNDYHVSAPRTGRDGKQYAAHRKSSPIGTAPAEVQNHSRRFSSRL